MKTLEIKEVLVQFQSLGMGILFLTSITACKSSFRETAQTEEKEESQLLVCPPGHHPIEIAGTAVCTRDTPPPPPVCTEEMAASNLCELGDTNDHRPPPVAPALTGALQVATGIDHTCALFTDNSVECWGKNQYGQLGVEGVSESELPIKTALGGVSQLVAGAYHTCALIGGSAWCWGRNHRGQLGIGHDIDEATPTEVTTLGNFSHLTAGHHHTCAIRTNGYATCWGANDRGQLGLGIQNTRTLNPISGDIVKGTDGYPGSPSNFYGSLYGVEDVTAGRAHTCFKIIGGRVFCAGDNTYKQIGIPSGSFARAAIETPGIGKGSNGSRATSIEAGADTTCAQMKSDGKLACWGRNHRHQIHEAPGSQTADAIFNVTPALHKTYALGGSLTCFTHSDNLYCRGELPGTSSSAVTRIGGNHSPPISVKDLSLSPDGKRACFVFDSEFGSSGTLNCFGHSGPANGPATGYLSQPY